MYLATSMYENYMKIKYCNDAIYPEDFFKNYIATNRPHLMHSIPYSSWELPLYEWNNFLIGFAWNTGDVFILVVSLGISHRFHQFNSLLESITDQYFEQKFWKSLRMDYVKLCDLVQYMDSHLSVLILVSTSHNLYVLIIVIFNGLK